MLQKLLLNQLVEYSVYYLSCLFSFTVHLMSVNPERNPLRQTQRATHQSSLFLFSLLALYEKRHQSSRFIFYSCPALRQHLYGYYMSFELPRSI